MDSEGPQHWQQLRLFSIARSPCGRAGSPLFYLYMHQVMRHLVQACLHEDRRTSNHRRSEEITVAVRADDLLEGNTADPKRHPIAIALRRQDDVDDARVTKNETRSAVARNGSAMRRLTGGYSRRRRSSYLERAGLPWWPDPNSRSAYLVG